MQARFMKQFGIAFALAGIACAAQAHRPWMLPTSTFIETEREAWVTIDGAVSEGLFNVDHLPLRMDGLTVTDPDGATAPAPAATVGKFRSSVDLRLPKDGTYRVTLAATNVMGSYKLNGETKRFRASEQAAAKEIPAGATDVKSSVMVQRQDTFVTLNKPSSGALKATGTGLELVPVTHPNELRAGEKASFRFQLNGQPLPNFPFSLIPGGVKYRGTINEVRLSTDAKGEASFTLPAANMYWLSAKYPVAESADAKRYSYSATLEILPE
ncbi:MULTISPECIES: DUF4198 domain-containing protein [unclassified Massilia]|uniref:DUF4198 domain-containing protein n=1 Tax=unclassified Massilia TaxID=2609279 RepID=UPI000AEC3C98|nr:MULTISPECIES: DUF4198 domain-containing protein [unclassified Massilia]